MYLVGHDTPEVRKAHFQMKLNNITTGRFEEYVRIIYALSRNLTDLLTIHNAEVGIFGTIFC